jgi:hypothetical protein
MFRNAKRPKMTFGKHENICARPSNAQNVTA